jgi:hypothetical protein
MNFITLLAAETINLNEVPGLPTGSGNDIFDSILNLLYFVIGIIAVIVIIVAGIRYSTSGGDSSKVSSAKNQILYAVVGLVVVMSAFLITNFVVGRF